MDTSNGNGQNNAAGAAGDGETATSHVTAFSRTGRTARQAVDSGTLYRIEGAGDFPGAMTPQAAALCAHAVRPLIPGRRYRVYRHMPASSLCGAILGPIGWVAAHDGIPGIDYCDFRPHVDHVLPFIRFISENG